MPSSEEFQNKIQPSLLRLKSIGFAQSLRGMLGKRIAVVDIKPYTDIDRVENESLLHIPETVKERNTPPATSGMVVKVGPAVRTINIGDGVVFSRWAGATYNIGNLEYRVMNENEVLFLIDDYTAEHLEEYAVPTISPDS